MPKRTFIDSIMSISQYVSPAVDITRPVSTNKFFHLWEKRPLPSAHCRWLARPRAPQNKQQSPQSYIPTNLSKEPSGHCG